MLKSATDALHKIWGHVSRQLEICEADIDAYKLRRRFFSPPDEILSMVLEFAALQDDGKDEKETIFEHRQGGHEALTRLQAIPRPHYPLPNALEARFQRDGEV